MDTVATEDDSLLIEDEEKHKRHTNMYAAAVFQLILAIGLGTIFSWLLTKTGLTFPIYIGAMLAAALIRNIAEYTNFTTIHMGEINDLGGISLSLFLGMAMITLKLWELASLALPLVILLAAQTLLIGVFTYFVIFRIMGMTTMPQFSPPVLVDLVWEQPQMPWQICRPYATALCHR